MTYPVPHPTSTATRGGRVRNVVSHSAASASTRRKLSCKGQSATAGGRGGWMSARAREGGRMMAGSSKATTGGGGGRGMIRG
eukprot:16134-Pelagococcus_subviridis.AAC.5